MSTEIKKLKTKNDLLLLVVGTEKSLQGLIKKLLSNDGFEDIHSSKTAVGALNMCEDFRYDIIITDQILDGSNTGKSWIADVKEYIPKAKTLLMYGDIKPKGTGADLLNKKPFVDNDEFLLLINTLADKRLREENQ